MRPIACIRYDSCEFFFVRRHYDIHLNGLCWYKNDLCEFDSYESKNGIKYVRIYQLSIKQKFIVLWNKKLFEWTNGYHWSYHSGFRRIDSFQKILDKFRIRRRPYFWRLVHSNEWISQKLSEWFYTGFINRLKIKETWQKF